MYFKPRFHKPLSEKAIYFSAETAVSICKCPFENYIGKTLNQKLFLQCGKKSENSVLCKKITFTLDFPEDIKKAIAAHTEIAGNNEEYAISLGEETLVYAKNPSGLLFALSTLLQMHDTNETSSCLLYDYPTCPVRGFRVFLPGADKIEEFKAMIDLLVYYKYNSIILEIGGAMEYKKHPEINERWIEYCKDMHRYSGRTKEIQFKTYTWHKNSIHCDNADGGVLTQDQCKDLLNYCGERGIEIIPECPTLSHCDYIVQAHPEIRERENDYHPDTYCPNHPDTYKIVFDIFDEVIDVFKPKRINIGHDELYTLCICERCKDKDPVDLYVNDITTIRNYLASKGVKTLMWGEKLLKAVADGKYKVGGWNDTHDINGVMFKAPDLYPCASRLPKDITFLHWYWNNRFDYKLDNVYHENGYEVLFGNFNAGSCGHFRERINSGVKGGFVSNWGSNEDEYMQRNLQYFALMITAYAFWSDEYDYDNRDEHIERTMQEAYRLHYAGKNNLIKVVHTTNHFIPYKFFYDGIFIEDELYTLGHYEALYDDNTTAHFPVKYGTNISCNGIEYDSQSYYEVSSSTIPVQINGKYFYKCAFENPYPQKNIVGFKYVPEKDKENIKVIMNSIDFSDCYSVETENNDDAKNAEEDTIEG